MAIPTPVTVDYLKKWKDMMLQKRREELQRELQRARENLAKARAKRKKKLIKGYKKDIADIVKYMLEL